MSYIVVEQPSDASTWITRAEVLVDGAVVATATLSPGRVRIPFPKTVGRSLRLRVTDYQGTGFPIISEIEAAGARVAPDREASSQECMTLGTLDGVPLKVRPVGAVDGEGPRLVAGCDTVRLAAGKHRLRSLPGWAADTLVLRDTLGESAVPGRAGPQLSVDRTSAAEYHVSAAAADEPYVLVVGQNIHPGWTATMDGADLGPATVVDGYAMGWVIRDLDAHTFRIRYAAQGASDVALAVSGGGLIVAGALLVIPSGPRLPAPARPAPVRQTPDRQAPVGQVGRRAGRRWHWLVFILGCGVFAGVAGALAGLVVALWVVLRRPASGTLVKAACARHGPRPAGVGDRQCAALGPDRTATRSGQPGAVGGRPSPRWSACSPDPAVPTRAVPMRTKDGTGPGPAGPGQRHDPPLITARSGTRASDGTAAPETTAPAPTAGLDHPDHRTDDRAPGPTTAWGPIADPSATTASAAIVAVGSTWASAPDARTSRREVRTTASGVPMSSQSALLPVGRDPAPGDERRQDVTFQRHDTRADRLHHPGREHIGSAVDLVRRRGRALLEERRHPTPGVGDDTPERPGIVHGADVEHRVEPVVGQRQLPAQVAGAVSRSPLTTTIQSGT